jgi:opacity protein-like surface antigen
VIIEDGLRLPHALASVTLCGGFELALDSNWSVKGEYTFIGLGDRHLGTTCDFARWVGSS